MSIENICNNALDEIGYERHIGNIYEGSRAARIALDIWAQTRDSLLYQLEPDWARKDARLVLAKSAPNIQGTTARYDVDTQWDNAYPPVPWLYEYTLPDDCLKPLQIKPDPGFLPVWRPRPQATRHVVNPDSETLLTNTPDAILIYIYRVLDPDRWHNDFQDAMIQVLAKKFSVELGKQQPQPRKQDADTAS